MTQPYPPFHDGLMSRPPFRLSSSLCVFKWWHPKWDRVRNETRHPRYMWRDNNWIIMAEKCTRYWDVLIRNLSSVHVYLRSYDCSFSSLILQHVVAARYIQPLSQKTTTKRNHSFCCTGLHHDLYVICDCFHVVNTSESRQSNDWHIAIHMSS